MFQPAWNLDTIDFDALVDIIAELETFRTESSRWAFMDRLMAGVERRQDILGQMDFSGPAWSAAVNLVSRFKQFGRLNEDDDGEVLGLLINLLISRFVHDAQKRAYLVSLFEKYDPHLGTATQNQGVKAWQTPPPRQGRKEAEYFENTLRHLYTLEQALQAAKAVAKLRLPGNKSGTAFLITDTLMMTNYHVLDERTNLNRSEVIFHYQMMMNGRHSRDKYSVPLQVDQQIITNPNLDFTVFELKRPVKDAQPLTLNPVIPTYDERVAIIQHPLGREKQIAMQGNFVTYADEDRIQYTTSTLEGSSGSPVFNDDFDVIAIHHSGDMADLDGGYVGRNEGTTMRAVLDYISGVDAALHRELTR